MRLSMHGTNTNNGADIFTALDQGFRSTDQDSAPQIDMWASSGDYKAFTLMWFRMVEQSFFSQNQLTHKALVEWIAIDMDRQRLGKFS